MPTKKKLDPNLKELNRINKAIQHSVEQIENKKYAILKEDIQFLEEQKEALEEKKKEIENKIQKNKDRSDEFCVVQEDNFSSLSAGDTKIKKTEKNNTFIEDLPIKAKLDIHKDFEYREEKDESSPAESVFYVYSSQIGTLSIAQVMGFSEACGRRLGTACGNVDFGNTDPLIFFDRRPQSWHFNINNPPDDDGTYNDSRIINSICCLKEAIRLCKELPTNEDVISINKKKLKKYNNDEKFQKEIKKCKKEIASYQKQVNTILLYLGTGLHPLQDVFFHTTNYVNDWGFKHHLLHLDTADDPYENKERPKTNEPKDLEIDTVENKYVNQNYSDQRTAVYWYLNTFLFEVKENIPFLRRICKKVKNESDMKNLLKNNDLIIKKRKKNMNKNDYVAMKEEYLGVTNGSEIYDSICKGYEKKQDEDNSKIIKQEVQEKESEMKIEEDINKNFIEKIFSEQNMQSENDNTNKKNRISSENNLSLFEILYTKSDANTNKLYEQKNQNKKNTYPTINGSLKNNFLFSRKPLTEKNFESNEIKEKKDKNYLLTNFNVVQKKKTPPTKKIIYSHPPFNDSTKSDNNFYTLLNQKQSNNSPPQRKNSSSSNITYDKEGSFLKKTNTKIILKGKKLSDEEINANKQSEYLCVRWLGCISSFFSGCFPKKPLPKEERNLLP